MEKELSALIGPLSGLILDLYARQLALTELVVSKGIATQADFEAALERAQGYLNRHPATCSLRVQSDANALIAAEPILKATVFLP